MEKEDVIRIGQRLAALGWIVTYKPRSHSHNVFSLFPQTAAQYDWLRRCYGTTYNVIIFKTKDQMLAEFPELVGKVKSTKCGDSCRIDLSL